MTTPKPAQSESAESIRKTIRDGYGQIARSGGWTSADSGSPASATSYCCGAGGCCGVATVDAVGVAQSVGYSASELAQIPDGANMGLSCGNPTALASLKPGEVVLDLGSGGGFDVFLAGPKVGPTGRVIGVDMTPDMVSKARNERVAYRERRRASTTSSSASARSSTCRSPTTASTSSSPIA